MSISPVGLGSWAIAGPNWAHTWGPQDDDVSLDTIYAAVEAGVNWLDTSPFYGLGHAEELIGRAISRFTEADRPLLFTKCGLTWDDDDPSQPPRKIAAPASIRQELDKSLRRLGVDSIDLYFVHWPGDGLPLEWSGELADTTSPDATELETYWEAMAQLKAAGKVAAIGLSNHGVPDLQRAERVAHVDAVQPQLSALDRSGAAEIEWCTRHGTGVVVFQPMHSGLLTGTFSAERVAQLAATDWRKADPDFNTGLDRSLVVTEALRSVAAGRGMPVAAIAVAWTLAWPGVTGAIVGARRPAQVHGWLPAANIQLTAPELAVIAAAIEGSGAGRGPVPAVPTDRNGAKSPEAGG